jgi:hypothetical protein
MPTEPKRTIPPAVYAVAAYEAARVFQEDPADLFDPDRKSRARYVAIAAIKRAFPEEAKAVIARNVGMEGDAKRISHLLDQAKSQKWWADNNVTFVEMVIAGSLRRPVTVVEVTADAPAPIVTEAEPRATSFVPRRIKPAKAIFSPGRPRCVTGYLMGDPNCRSARIDRGEISGGIV